MRTVIIGAYDTYADGALTLTSCVLSAPSYKSSFVAVPGRDGDLDLSTALTDGEPRYNNRTLTLKFESSEGTRAERQEILDELVNLLDGKRLNVTLPDYTSSYLVGRVSVAVEYNDLAHCAVTITANCEPWRYANSETKRTITATTTDTAYKLYNAGRRTAVPTFTVTGGDVTIVKGNYSTTLSAGAYLLPDITVPTGGASITVSGSGTLTATYREANL